MRNLVKTGVLADATPLVVPVGNMDAPMTVTLTSGAAGRLIELSSNGGNAGGWYTPMLDADIATMCNVGVMSPISHIRVTGQVGDVWRVQ